MSYINLFTLAMDVLALLVMLFLQFNRKQPLFLLASTVVWLLAIAADWFAPNTLISITPKSIYLALTFIAAKSWITWNNEKSRAEFEKARRELQEFEDRVRELLTMPTGDFEEATRNTIGLPISE